ncbi:hypothetical protein ACFLYS_02205 [Chloroflexota bacterium]
MKDIVKYYPDISGGFLENALPFVRGRVFLKVYILEGCFAL